LMDSIVAVDAPLAQDIKALRKTHRVTTAAGAAARTETVGADSVAMAAPAEPPT
jgi:hypothetical protein